MNLENSREKAVQYEMPLKVRNEIVFDEETLRGNTKKFMNDCSAERSERIKKQLLAQTENSKRTGLLDKDFNPKNEDIGEIVRFSLAGRGRKGVDSYFQSLGRNCDESNPILDKVKEAVRANIEEGKEINVDGLIESHISEKGNQLSEKDLDELQTALHLATMEAQSDLFGKGADEKIKRVAKIWDGLNSKYPDFEERLEKAGFKDAYESLQAAIAAMELDDEHKRPNQEAREEKKKLMLGLLESLGKIKAKSEAFSGKGR